MEKIYISSKDTAKHIRKALKASFPKQVFSVRSDHNCITIHWEDGPLRKDVEAITEQYEAGGFDGMIDLDYSQSHYLFPDGSIALQYREGTSGSNGYISEIDNRSDSLPEGTKIVQFGAKYIFCTRHITDYETKYKNAVQWIRNNCVITGNTGTDWADMFGGKSVETIARDMTMNHMDTLSVDDIGNLIIFGKL
jgi:hypothetical protein